MRILVTGAAGFLGRALVDRLTPSPLSDSQTLMLTDKTSPPRPGEAHSVVGDLSSQAVLDAIAHFAPDLVYHLAAAPGGASETDPQLSRRVNLNASLALIEALGASDARPRFIYASSIAVLGAPLPIVVDDTTPPRPAMTYGAHKLMVETAVADAARRGLIQGLALRIPGLVARPSSGVGLKSAFMSDVFTALRDARSFTMPVAPDGRIWVMSVARCVDNLILAATTPLGPAQPWPAMTLPTLHVRIDALVEAIGRAVGVEGQDLVRYAPDPALQAQFAAYPPLQTPLALAMGFSDDGNVAGLVSRALAGLRSYAAP